MRWVVEIADEFMPEFTDLQEEVQDAIIVSSRLLERFGPLLKRPHVDTLKGSKYANMKELRINVAGGVWRLAFAFDPKRRALLLVAGDKSGGSQTQFYRELIRRADLRFSAHLERFRKETNK
jgi:hypothetical protein